MEASRTQTQQQPDAATLGALLVILMSGQAPDDMAKLAAPLLLPFGIPPAAAAGAIGLIWPHLEHDVNGATAEPLTAIAHTLRTQPAREAAYVFNAAKRLAATRDLSSERRYFAQHLAAERGRRDAARAVDSLAAKLGTDTLEWWSHRDSKTTAGCRAMHGKPFNVAAPPLVEGRPAYPGAVHPECRCKAVPLGTVAGVREPTRVLVGA